MFIAVSFFVLSVAFFFFLFVLPFVVIFYCLRFLMDGVRWVLFLVKVEGYLGGWLLNVLSEAADRLLRGYFTECSEISSFDL